MRLIDADTLQEKAQLAYRIALCEDDLSSGRYNNVEFTDDFAISQDDIDEQPTVDAVEVVRCKDCKFKCDQGTLTCGYWSDGKYNPAVEPDDFCSYGKRKEAT